MFAGQVQSEQPQRINGVLKKVWRHMGNDQKLQWQTMPKPVTQEQSI